MSVTIYATALEAIRHSDQYGEISYCEDTPDNRSRLLIESDLHANNDFRCTEDRSGNVWRVIIVA